MKPDTLFAERKIAVHLLRKGEKVANVASEINRSDVWVRKWWKRSVTRISPHASAQQSASLQTTAVLRDVALVSQNIIQIAFKLTTHLTEQVFDTMY